MARSKSEAPDHTFTVADLNSLSFQERLAIGLHRLRSERGWTNRELAAKLGVSEGYMSQVGRGKRDVKLTTLDKMTREWNVSIDELFTVTEEDLQRIEEDLRRTQVSKGRRRRRKTVETTS